MAVDEAPEFVGVTESLRYVANECRVAVAAKSINEVHRLAAIAVKAGARNIEGPTYGAPEYYVLFAKTFRQSI